MRPRIPARPKCFKPAELAIPSETRTRMGQVSVAAEGSADQVEEASVAGAADRVGQEDQAGVAAQGNAEIPINSRGNSATGASPTGFMAWCFSISPTPLLMPSRFPLPDWTCLSR